jgi:hypothetical protein
VSRVLVSASRRNELSWRFVADFIELVRKVRAGEDASANARDARAPQNNAIGEERRAVSLHDTVKVLTVSCASG